MEVYGYKCFKKGLVNVYGASFKVGETYHCDETISFWGDEHGYHMCEMLEDTFRFFDTFLEDVDVCLVVGFGNYIKCDDEYNGYFDMYAFQNMRIVKKLTREEIISYGLDLQEFRLRRFISSFKLNDEEKRLFRDKFKNDTLINELIDYYQDNKKDAFQKKRCKTF